MQVLRVGLYTEVYRPIRNGVVTSVDALASGLVSRGVDVTCVAPYHPGAVDDRAYVRRIRSFPLPTKTGYRLALPFARADRTRTVVHAHSPFVTGAMALRAARLGGVPLVFSYHTRLPAYAHYAPVDARIARASLEFLTRAYANAAAAVVVPTNAIRDELRAIGVRARIEVVPTGVDVARLRAAPRDANVRARLGARGDAALVLWAGRIGHEKNLPLALAAFAELDRAGARLAIVGDGVLRARMQRAARDAGIDDRVTFAGEVPAEAMAEIYAASDVLLFTSTTETQGLVISEARASGLAIVAVDGAVTREVAGPDARLAPGEPAALARSLGVALDDSRRTAAPPDGDDRSTLDAMLALYHSLRD